MIVVDGDKSLVVADKAIINIAKRNIQKFDIVPLYYNMAKSLPSLLNTQTIYNSLILAFTSGNIGYYSNNISKIWNSEIFISGSDKEKQHALDCIKRLCCQNNFVIDGAKTLYIPEFPTKIKNEIKEFTKLKLPRFFIYAKDKTLQQVNNPNDSLVNQLDNIIPNPRIGCKYINEYNHKQKLSTPDYLLLMSEPYLIAPDDDNPIVLKYLEIAKNYWQKINPFVLNNLPRDVWSKTQIRKKILYDNIVNDTKAQLNKIEDSENQIVDTLVWFLYSKKSKYKDLLWTCYGDIILSNLKHNQGSRQTKDIQCLDCGDWFEVNLKNTKTYRCPQCQANKNKESIRIRKQRERKAKCHVTKDN